MSADLVGHTRLMELDELGTLRALESYRKLLARCIDQHGGRVVDAVGDNLLAEFHSAVRALEGAVEAQRELRALNADVPPERRLAFRIGLHVGDVLVDGEQIAGVSVNTAARIQALAEPGGITLSGALFDQVSGKLGLELESLGEKSLKNIERPVPVYRVRLDSDGPASVQPLEGAAARSADQVPAIAVLPFENLSGDPDQQYLADGIAEDLINQMVRSTPRVIARSSSFACRDHRTGVVAIGRELGARYLLGGTVRRAGNRLRLTAHLIDADEQRTIWAEQWDRELGDLFAVQDEIVNAIRRSIGMRIVRNEEDRAKRMAPSSMGAWENTARASWHLALLTREGAIEGLRFARRAVELDPGFANAHAMVSFIHHTFLTSGWSRDREADLAAALAAARTAKSLDLDSQVANQALGTASFLAGDSRRARVALERAVELAPEWASARNALGWFYALSGSPEEAVPLLETVLRLSNDPRVVESTYTNLAIAHLAAGRDEVALNWAQRAFDQRDDPVRRGVLASVLGHVGRTDEARRLLSPSQIFRIRNVAPLIAHMHEDLVSRLIEGLRLAGAEE